jgi:hypothetical protein
MLIFFLFLFHFKRNITFYLQYYGFFDALKIYLKKKSTNNSFETHGVFFTILIDSVLVSKLHQFSKL